MNSRERVLCALNHQEPDTVPVYFGGTSCFFTDSVYFRLKKFLGLKHTVLPYRFGHTGNYIDNDLLDFLGSDVRFLYLQIGLQEKRIDSHTVMTDWGIPIRTIGGYGTRVDPPLAEIDPEDNPDQALEKLHAFTWPNPFDERRIEALPAELKRLQNETDACLVARSPQSASFLEYGGWLRGESQFFSDLLLHEEFCNALFDRIMEVQIGFYQALLQVVGKHVDIVETSEDYGTGSSLLISPDLFRQYIKPRRSRINSEIKKIAPQAKILHHSCGCIRPIIPDLVEAGVDILNPVQPGIPGMEGPGLKKDFGETLTFCGGIDMIKAMPGKPEDIEKEVKLRIEEFGAGGGYFLSTSNHIQEDTPPENILRLFEYARKYGRY
jgi:uroporphyrinogen decarboxylase